MPTSRPRARLKGGGEPDLAGLRAAVDVQHLYRTGARARDRGSLYTLEGGGKLYEADCVTHYASALTGALRDSGAQVWTNEPRTGILCGPYAKRQRDAEELGAVLYLACHLNAGGGSYTLTEFIEGYAGHAVGRAIVDEIADSFPGWVKKTTVRALLPGERGRVCIVGFRAGPAVILEPLFGDNPKHQALLTHASLEAVGLAIARGVTTWWRSAASHFPDRAKSVAPSGPPV